MLARKLSKKAGDSSARYAVFDARGPTGSPRAPAREDEELPMLGGGGVGYEEDGIECCRTDCANGVDWYADGCAYDGDHAGGW